LRDGVCECEFNYKVTARTSSGYILIDFFNLDFNTTLFDLYEGTYDCSELFNITANETDEHDLSLLRCSATNRATSKGPQTRVRIESTDENLLREVVRENVELELKETLFTQECVQGEVPLFYTIDFPRSTPGCQSCGF